MASDESEQLHALFMDLVRVAGLLQPDQDLPGHMLSLSQAYAIHELDRDTGDIDEETEKKLREELDKFKKGFSPTQEAAT